MARKKIIVSFFILCILNFHSFGQKITSSYLIGIWDYKYPKGQASMYFIDNSNVMIYVRSDKRKTFDSTLFSYKLDTLPNPTSLYIEKIKGAITDKKKQY